MRYLLLLSLLLLVATAALAQGERGPLVAVSCTLEDTVVMVDPRSVRVVGRIRTGPAPGMMAVYGNWIAVAESRGDGIGVIDLRRGRVAWPVRGKPLELPRGMAFSSDGSRLWVLGAASETLVEVETGSWRVRRVLPLRMLGSSDLRLSPDGARAYAIHRASGVLSVVDLERWHLIGQSAVGVKAGGVALHPDGEVVYVTLPAEKRVRLYDAASGRGIGEVPTGQGPGEVEVALDGSLAVVVNEVSGDVTVFPPRDLQKRWRIGAGMGARRVAMTPDGRWAYVTNYDSGDLSVLDLVEGRALGRLPVGKGPQDVVWVP